jgi:outer membrane protein OmpA-like peptidoglycan-associated protein
VTAPDDRKTPPKASGGAATGNRRARPRAGRSRGRQLALPVTVATVGLATLGVVQALPNRQAVQNQLTDRSTRALSAAGISGAQVHFDGRDATVHVRSAGDRDRALAIVRSQQGVRIANVIVDRRSPGADKTPSDRPSKRPTTPSPPAQPGPAMPSAPATARSGPPTAHPGHPGSVATPTPGRSPSRPAPNPPPGTTGSTPPGATGSAPPPSAAGSTPPPGPTGSAPPPGVIGDGLAQVQNAVNACGPVQFASASAALTPAGRKVVGKVAAILRGEFSVDVEIQGFADAIGPSPANLALSSARARTVYDTLRVLGITAARMSPVGYGESHPRFPNDSRAHEAANRRVAFAVRADPAR